MVHSAENIYYQALYRKGVQTLVFQILHGMVPPSGLPPCTIPGELYNHHLCEWLARELCSAQPVQPYLISSPVSRPPQAYLLLSEHLTQYRKLAWQGLRAPLKLMEHEEGACSPLQLGASTTFLVVHTQLCSLPPKPQLPDSTISLSE